MVRMSVRIDLTEDEEGKVRSRVAVGVNTDTPPNFSIVDHMLRKIDETMLQAKAQLTEQCKLQNIPTTEMAPF